MSAANGAVAIAAVSKPWNPLSWFRRKPKEAPAEAYQMKNGKMVPVVPPAERWLVEAVADLYFSNHRSYRLTTSTIIGEETAELSQKELYAKYKPTLEKWVEAHKKEIRLKKWTGTRGQHASLIRTANVDYVLYSIRIKKVEEK